MTELASSDAKPRSRHASVIAGDRTTEVATGLQWRAHVPLAADESWDGAVPGWLAELRRFRAEMLYADGLRPAFRGSDGIFCDDDPSDPFAYHVVAIDDGKPIATFRVLRLTATHSGVCERLLGTDVLNQWLSKLGIDRAQAWEGSGWAVQPTRRGSGVGLRTLAAGEAVATQLGLTQGIGATGTRYGQLQRVLSAGYRPVPGLDPIPVPTLADDIQIVYGTLTALRPTFRALVTQTANLLEWQDARPTGTAARTAGYRSHRQLQVDNPLGEPLTHS